MKRMLALLLGTALLLTACGNPPEKTEEQGLITDAPGKVVTSDTLRVEKVENLPEECILGMDASCVPAL